MEEYVDELEEMEIEKDKLFERQNSLAKEKGKRSFSEIIKKMDEFERKEGFFEDEFDKSEFLEVLGNCSEIGKRELKRIRKNYYRNMNGRKGKNGYKRFQRLYKVVDWVLKGRNKLI